MYINERNAILLFIGAIIATTFVTTHQAQGETGKGDTTTAGLAENGLPEDVGGDEEE